MRLLNITIECENDEEAYHLENHLRDSDYKIISCNYIADTKKMYEEDKTFQRLVKKEKEVKKMKAIYINDNNGRYTKKD